MIRVSSIPVALVMILAGSGSSAALALHADEPRHDLHGKDATKQPAAGQPTVTSPTAPPAVSPPAAGPASPDTDHPWMLGLVVNEGVEVLRMRGSTQVNLLPIPSLRLGRRFSTRAEGSVAIAYHYRYFSPATDQSLDHLGLATLAATARWRLHLGSSWEFAPGGGLLGGVTIYDHAHNWANPATSGDSTHLSPLVGFTVQALFTHRTGRWREILGFEYQMGWNLDAAGGSTVAYPWWYGSLVVGGEYLP